MRNKHLRMLVGIVTYPFKTRRNYKCLEINAYWRSEQKKIERSMHFKSLCKK